jgi:hypothetical protein
MTDRVYPEPVFDDEHDARARAQTEKERLREQARLTVREKFPECTKFADMVREAFGDGAKITYAIEDGLYVGDLPEKRKKQHEAELGPLRRLRFEKQGDSN